MVWPLFFGAGLLSVVASAASNDHIKKLYKFTNITLKPGEKVDIESLYYPMSAPPNLAQTWIITTQPGVMIALACTDIRLLPASPCGDYGLIVSDTHHFDDVCGARLNFKKVSRHGRMAVGLRTGPLRHGYVKCQAQAYLPTNDTASNETDDSLEREIRGAKRITTCKCGWTNGKGSQDEGRIFGGKETYVNEFPFVAGIARKGQRIIFCGASIVTPFHALSAAHCFYNKTMFGPFVLIVGEHNQQRDDETTATDIIPIKDSILHKEYDPKKYLNDIALVIVSRETKFSQLVGPVCLPNGPIKLDKELVTVIGWGTTPTEPRGSPVLRKVDLRVVPKDLCAKIRPSIPPGSPHQLCTYGKHKSACSGDSGGPVVWIDPDNHRYFLVGINSYGTAECGNGIPRVSTDVTTYTKWILNEIKANGPSYEPCSKD